MCVSPPRHISGVKIHFELIETLKFKTIVFELYCMERNLPRETLEPGHQVEVAVPGQYRKCMLPRECGNPDIVGGNSLADLP